MPINSFILKYIIKVQGIQHSSDIKQLRLKTEVHQCHTRPIH